MVRKLILITVFLIVYQFVFCQKSDIKQIADVVKSGYLAYLQKIPVGHEIHFGFNSRDEFNKVEIGRPYELYIFNTKKEGSHYFNNPNDVIPKNEWLIPLKVDGNNRVLITVAKVAGQWMVVNIGSSGLANEIENFEKSYNSTLEYGKILNVMEIPCDFLMTEEHENISLLPFQNAKIAMGAIETKNIGLNEFKSMVKDLKN